MHTEYIQNDYNCELSGLLMFAVTVYPNVIRNCVAVGEGTGVKSQSFLWWSTSAAHITSNSRTIWASILRFVLILSNQHTLVYGQKMYVRMNVLHNNIV